MDGTSGIAALAQVVPVTHGDVSVELPGEPSFVNWREQQRRMEAGLDPFTGEPW
ncbi:hypothetical protein [Streptomyces sp. ECR3.8]|uniref:hypothetical protein n=1 Tax=Streptomyces sp. ECR3.8 TaxID=3461009 RepID=UPI004042EFC1